MRRSLLLPATLIAVGLLPLPAHALTLNPGTDLSRVEARARDTGPTPETVYDIANPVGAPTSGSLLATDGTINYEASSSADYDFSASGLATSFDFDMPERSSAFTGFYEETYFSPDVSSTYAFSGDFSSTHSAPGRTTLSITLTDLTTGNVVFHNVQRSTETQNESFVVGGQAGDFVNELTGATTGLLLSDHDYSLIQFAWINNAPFGITAGTGSGSLTLALTQVPEPGTAFLLGLGLSILARRPSPRC